MKRFLSRKIVALAAAGLVIAGPVAAVEFIEPASAATSVRSLSEEQRSNAKTIIEETKRLGFTNRAAMIAVATAMQESSLRNLSGGDRDSVGLFQQRPSMGWGSVAQCRTPKLAVAAFLGVAKHTHNPGLKDVAGWEKMPLSVAAQKVQRSAYPDAYARWESLAKDLVEKYAPEAKPTRKPEKKPTAQATGGTGRPKTTTARPTVRPTGGVNKPGRPSEPGTPTGKPAAPTAEPTGGVNKPGKPAQEPTRKPAKPVATPIPPTAPTRPRTPAPPVEATQPPAKPEAQPVDQAPIGDPAPSTDQVPLGDPTSGDPMPVDQGGTADQSGTADDQVGSGDEGGTAARPAGDSKSLDSKSVDTSGGLADTGAPVPVGGVVAAVFAIGAGGLLLARRRS